MYDLALAEAGGVTSEAGAKTEKKAADVSAFSGLWGWRLMARSSDLRRLPRSELTTPRFSVATLSLLCEEEVSVRASHCEPTLVFWETRCRRLLRELMSMEADVICLQEMDRRSWWLEQLSLLGYDALYLRRPRRRDGLALAFQRDKLQLIKSEEVLFDELAAGLDDNRGVRRKTGHVALMAVLRPIGTFELASPFVVACAQLEGKQKDINRLQAEHLLLRLQRFNVDFQLPHVLAGDLGFLPDTPIYHVYRTGSLPVEARPPFVPRDVRVVKAEKTWVTLEWTLPHSDAAITGHVITRRAGGVRALGFRDEAHVGAACRATVGGLSTGTTYEFRVAAVSDAGTGPFSPPTRPVRTVVDEELRPDDDVLRHPTVKEPLLGAGVQPEPTGHTPRYEDGSKVEDWTSDDYTGKHVTLLRLESAYHTRADGEPRRTVFSEGSPGTVDYLFYSRDTLVACSTLTLPSLDELKGIDVRQPVMVPDPTKLKPDDWDDRRTLVKGLHCLGVEVEMPNPGFDGEWHQEYIPNPRRDCLLLPNAGFGSDHVVLMAQFAFLKKAFATSLFH
eukprot:PLAT15277.2.p1 GENE.PLAT15277.2~~PLAT15277.2.p1  ORF type:complete len:591 (+),score=217.38 PLAT15277.2:93-1775(+)